MVLSRNQKIVLGVVGSVLVTAGTVMVVKAVRRNRAKDDLKNAKKAEKDFLKKEEEILAGNKVTDEIIPELKPYVVVIQGENADELKARMDDLITAADELKHSKFPPKKDEA